MFKSLGSSASGGEVFAITLSLFQFRFAVDVGPSTVSLLHAFGFSYTIVNGSVCPGPATGSLLFGRPSTSGRLFSSIVPNVPCE